MGGGENGNNLSKKKNTITTVVFFQWVYWVKHEKWDFYISSPQQQTWSLFSFNIIHCVNFFKIFYNCLYLYKMVAKIKMQKYKLLCMKPENMH